MRVKRKHVFNTFFIVLALILIIHVLSALTLDRSIQYKEISYTSPKIGPELDGYVIAFVTDTHEISTQALENVVSRINGRKIDLLLLGGDYAKNNAESAMSILSRVKTTDGIFGVDGNHDDWHDLRTAMQAHNMTLLYNNGRELHPGFYLAGVICLNNARGVDSDVKSALQNASANSFVLLLMHIPDVSMLQDTSRADLMLAGHTHGGQITLFGQWAPALKKISIYGHKFMNGWAQTNWGGNIFVCRGLGSSFNRIRIFARPQVIFLTLRTVQAAND